jgi:hypothetical protein
MRMEPFVERQATEASGVRSTEKSPTVPACTKALTESKILC